MAAGWERSRERTEKYPRQCASGSCGRLTHSGAKTVLELAAGPGDRSFEVAPALGGEGLLISIDRAPAMVDVSRRRAAELGLRSFEHELLDAEQLDLEDDSVNHVLYRFGYMLMADPAQAARDTPRP